MLLNLYKFKFFFTNQFLIRFKKKWSSGLTLENMDVLSKRNENALKEMSKLAKNYSSWIDDEMKKTSEEMVFDFINNKYLYFLDCFKCWET